MKNKLNLLRLTKRMSIIGLSLVLSGNIICSNSFAFRIISGGCDHRGRYWDISNSAPYYAYYAACCKYKDTSYYYYNNPELNFTFKKPNNTTTPYGVIAFEKGTKIPNTLISFSPNNGENDPDDNPPSKYEDNFTSTLELDDTEVSLDISTGSLDISSYDLGKHTLYAEVNDTYYYDDSLISTTKNFYIGPYPTIYYNAHLIDGNIDSDYTNHKDSIKIENIKLVSTYKPKSLIFKIYANGTVQEKTIPLPSTYTNKYYLDSSGNEVGYITEFDDFTMTLTQSNPQNILPSSNPYVIVQVNDGRGTGTSSTTNPTMPKRARFSRSIATL